MRRFICRDSRAETLKERKTACGCSAKEILACRKGNELYFPKLGGKASGYEWERRTFREPIKCKKEFWGSEKTKKGGKDDAVVAFPMC